MVTLQKYNFTHFPYLDYRLDEEQDKFTAIAPVALERLTQRNLQGDFSAFPITIFFERLPAGFFVLDFGNDKLDLSDNPNSVLLRSLSINPKFQGKGVGKNAMLKIPELLKNYFPQTTEIVLAVNEKNTVAAVLYEKCGYIFSSKTRIGTSGLQRIMIKYL